MNTSGAVRLGNTLYRISEVAWLKVQRLTLWEKLANGLLILSGLVFIHGIYEAKGTYLSVEALLGLLPILLGLAIHGDTRLASSGDTQDSYFGRGLGIDVNIRDLAAPLRDYGQKFLELNGTGNAYYYLINVDRIAWVSSWFTLNTWPLWMAVLFGGYDWVLGQDFKMPSMKWLSSLHILDYSSSSALGFLKFASFMCILAGVLATLASIKQGVIIGSVGGVADTLHMYKADRQRLHEVVAGPPLVASVAVPAPPTMTPPPPPPPPVPPVESTATA